MKKDPRETAKQQYHEYKEKGIEGVPHFSKPYLDFLAHYGEVKTDITIKMYSMKHYQETPCVKNGLLMLSYKKYLDENRES